VKGNQGEFEKNATKRQKTNNQYNNGVVLGKMIGKNFACEVELARHSV